MSHVTKYYISEVLEEVCQRLGGISEHVFPEHRPAAAGKQMDDFIVVSLPVSIEDQKRLPENHPAHRNSSKEQKPRRSTYKETSRDAGRSDRRVPYCDRKVLGSPAFYLS